MRAGNAALDAADRDGVAKALEQVIGMLEVLGLNPASAHWSGVSESSRDAVDALVRVALAQREEARARRDFAAADQIRDGLSAAGIRIEDTPQGARWEFIDTGTGA
jgi:cysteinyl-tRNA synthetase